MNGGGRGRRGVLGRRNRRRPQRERQQGRESEPRTHVDIAPIGQVIAPECAVPATQAGVASIAADAGRYAIGAGILGHIRQKVDSQRLRFHTRCWGGCPQPRSPMDLYIVLGVRREASADDIRRAYKRLARRYHPDINPGDREAAARFRDILVGLRDAGRSRAAPALRPRRSAAGATAPRRVRRVRLLAARARRAAPPPSAICSPACSRRRRRAAGRRAAPMSTSRDRRRSPTSLPPPATPITWSREVVLRGLRRQPGRPGAGRPSASPARAPAACRSCAATCCSRPPCSRCGGAGPAAGQPLRGVRGPRHRRRAPSRWRSTCRPASPTAPSCACRVWATPAARGGPPGDLHVAVARRRRIRSTAATATTCTSTCRWRSTKPRSAPASRCGCSTARRSGCGCRPARSRASASGCASAACRRRATAARGDVVAEVRLMLPRVLDERAKDLLREFGGCSARACATAGSRRRGR